MKRSFICMIILVLVLAGQAFADYKELIKQEKYQEALKEIKPLADSGNVDAQYNFGEMYYFGNGVKKDYAEALKWYRKAADQGNADAQLSLGIMYKNGQGVEKNENEAKKWNKKALEVVDIKLFQPDTVEMPPKPISGEIDYAKKDDNQEFLVICITFSIKTTDISIIYFTAIDSNGKEYKWPIIKGLQKNISDPVIIDIPFVLPKDTIIRKLLIERPLTEIEITDKAYKTINKGGSYVLLH